MPNFNNCQTGIYANGNSTVSFNTKVLMKDASVSAATVRNNSYLTNQGISGNTGSSFDIVSCTRGLQVESSHVDIKYAKIQNTRYGVIAKNGTTFNFNNSEITTTDYTSFTGQAYGMYVSDGSIGNFFDSSVTGYAGGTASLTSGNFVVVKASKIFVGATAQKQQANTTALGADLVGDVYVDTTKGNTIILGNPIVEYLPPGDLPE